MHSIRFRIIAITIAAILTTILCVFAVSYSTLYAENDRISVRMMNLIGQDTVKSLEKYTESIEQSVEMTTNTATDWLDSVILAENEAIGDGVSSAGRTAEQTKTLDEYLQGYLRRVQESFGSVATHTHGVVAYFYCIDPEISRNEHGFFCSRVGKTGFEAQPPLDPTRFDPADAENNTWYYTPIQRGRPSWVGPYLYCFPEETWTYSYIAPIYRAGALIGVLGMDIPFSVLVDQIDAIRVYDTGYACLVGADNTILYHPSLPMGSPLEAMGISGLSEKLDQASSGDELIRYTAEGEERQLSFCTLSNGMKLLITAPVKEINASWIGASRIILFVIVGIIIGFMFLLMMAMKIITQPLGELTIASRRLAEGDYDVELNYSRSDEVGELTRSFTMMRDQQKQYIDDLNRQIYTDKLTGLPNMRWFFKLAENRRREMREAGSECAILYFNLIGMKQYNRQYGFDEGDRLIRLFGNTLRDHYAGRVVGHISQDHFAVLADTQNLEAEARALFEKCQGANDGRMLPVSLGVYPDALEDVSITVACDRAKYACDQHRGAYVSGIRYFDKAMLKRGETLRYIVNNLERAIQEGWIKVYYQSIIRTADGKICDEEALSRWIDPVVGFLSPADFIPALEDAKLIYKLDLYVVEQVLQKMKKQAEAGMFVVSQSINLSRMDFDSCDIVEEIRRRVDAAGIERSMLNIEITESVIGSDFDFMKTQVERFQELGFPVWMDDFGSGYSSLDVLQNIHFDLIKFDMRFMEHFNEGDEGKIILTELTKMAIGLGVETVCEGVEYAEQVEFLREIGCTRIQGYYYGRPQSFDDMLKKFSEGSDLGFENPEEAEYYATLGRVNLYDMAVISSEDDDSLNRYFNTLPMAIVEVNGDRAEYARCNRSYRDFVERLFGVRMSGREMAFCNKGDGRGAAFMSAVLRCSRDGKRAIVDEILDERTSIHAIVRRVAVNPVNGTVAVAVAILAVIEENRGIGASFASITRALSSDYLSLYYVDTETDRFIVYSPNASLEDLAVERRGMDFFNASARDARTMIYREDRDYFIEAFTKQNVLKTLEERDSFTLDYRLMMDGVPTYVNLKAVRMPGDGKHIIIGVNNVDAQMRQKEEMARVQAERTTYSRVNALTKGFICIYTVDPETDHFLEYSATEDYAGLGLAREGEDFFTKSRQESARILHPEDRGRFQGIFTRQNVMEEIERTGLFSYRYRIMMDGAPVYVELKAALVDEKDGPQLIIGVNNVDASVRREQAFERELSAARSKANLDALTGVRNREAYENMSLNLARQIEHGQAIKYAIALCRPRDVARVNETRGREAGNQLIREACAIVCDTFKHSPVFRVSGDQFAAIIQGHDYECLDALIEALKARNQQNAASGGAVIAYGVAKYDGQESVAAVFEQAESICRGEA